MKFRNYITITKSNGILIACCAFLNSSLTLATGKLTLRNQLLFEHCSFTVRTQAFGELHGHRGNGKQQCLIFYFRKSLAIKGAEGEMLSSQGVVFYLEVMTVNSRRKKITS